MAMQQAKSGDTVKIHYTGRLTDGSEFDSSAGRDPLEFTLGAGQVIPGLEVEIDGMTVGESQTITVPAEAAYGSRDPQKLQKVDRSLIPDDIDLNVGMQLGAKTQTGEQISFTVVDVSDQEVTVDANHPLAGRDLVFEVELVAIV
jgi:peptidylprolyl isomerase